ncbi:unnamed protein product, partial [Candidula unifasciata]
MKPQATESSPLLASRSATDHSVDDSQLLTTTRCRASVVMPLVVFTYFLGYYTLVCVLNPYLYDVVAEEMDYKHNSSSQKPCAERDRNHTNTTGNKVVIQEMIQKKVATTELYLSLPCYVCAAISILTVGPLTDKYGRKVGFLFPIVGTFIKQIVYAAVVGLHLPPLILIVGHMFESFGGSFAAMLTSMFTVVSDITNPGRQRSFRITVMEAMQTLTGAAGGYVIGQWIKVSYFQPVIFSAACGVVSLLIAIFLLPETIQKRRLVAPVTVTYPRLWLRIRACTYKVLPSCWQKFKRTFSLFVSDHCQRHNLDKRRLCLAVFILTVAVNFSTPGVQTLYLMKWPRCWPATRILTFGSIQILCNWVAILLLMALMQKVFKLADRQIAMFGVISSITHAVFMSLASNDVMIYEVAVVGVMIRAIIPMLRSVMSLFVLYKHTHTLISIMLNTHRKLSLRYVRFF